MELRLINGVWCGQYNGNHWEALLINFRYVEDIPLNSVMDYYHSVWIFDFWQNCCAIFESHIYIYSYSEI